MNGPRSDKNLLIWCDGGSIQKKANINLVVLQSETQIWYIQFFFFIQCVDSFKYLMLIVYFFLILVEQFLIVFIFFLYHKIINS